MFLKKSSQQRTCKCLTALRSSAVLSRCESRHFLLGHLLHPAHGGGLRMQKALCTSEEYLGPNKLFQSVVSDSGLVHPDSALSSLTWGVICCLYYFNRVSFHLFLDNFLPATNVSCLYSFQLPLPHSPQAPGHIPLPTSSPLSFL